MKIANEHIKKLRDHDLFVGPPKASNHVYPDGVLVGKPASVAGNHIPDYSTAFITNLEAGEEVSFDAPPVWLYGHCGVWLVVAVEYSPSPGPGDFTDEWSSPEEAIQDILDFYFGNPTRMQEKAEARKKPYFRSNTPENTKQD